MCPSTIETHKIRVVVISNPDSIIFMVLLGYDTFYYGYFYEIRHLTNLEEIGLSYANLKSNRE